MLEDCFPTFPSKLETGEGGPRYRVVKAVERMAGERLGVAVGGDVVRADFEDGAR